MVGNSSQRFSSLYFCNGEDHVSQIIVENFNGSSIDIGGRAVRIRSDGDNQRSSNVLGIQELLDDSRRRSRLRRL